MTDKPSPPAPPGVPAQLTAPTRHRFVSPHYDDIALSCGGTAALLARHGPPAEVEVVVAFGAEPDPAAPSTPFAAAMHATWGLDPAGAVAARRREEAAAAAVLGITSRSLPFQDAIYRGTRYASRARLFGPVLPDEADLPARLATALGGDAAPDAALRLYAPLAIGRHDDHQHSFAAGVRMARAGWDVWFYEDLPYALRPGARAERLATAGVPLTVAAVVDVDATWPTKLAAIMAYPSQLTAVFVPSGAGPSRGEIDAVMRAYAVEAGGGRPAERFWRLVQA